MAYSPSYYPAGPSYGGGNYRSGDRISDLLAEQGRIEGNAALRSGELWGNTLAGLGKTIGAGIEQFQEKKALKKRDSAWAGFVNDREWMKDPQIALAGASKIWGPEKGPEKAQGLIAFRDLSEKGDRADLERLPMILKSTEDAPDETMVDWYPKMLAKAAPVLERQLGMPIGSLPAQWDPKLRPRLIALRKALSGEKPEPLTEVSPGASLYDRTKNASVFTASPLPVKPEKGPALGSFEDYLVRTAGPNPTPEQTLTARKAYNQADDRPRVDVHVGGDGGVGTLDPDGLELAATAYRLTKALPARNAEQNGAIISAAARQGKLLGNSPVVTLQRQAAYKADDKALSKMQSMSSAAEAFEQKALSQADIVATLSQKVGRTQIPLLNQAILTGKRDILGDADTQLLYNAITTFSSEYAKIMEGSTGSAAASSDSARKAAAKLVDASLNKVTLAKTIDLMRREMRLSIQGYDTTIAHITERMGGAPTVPGAPAAPTTADPLGLR